MVMMPSAPVTQSHADQEAGKGGSHNRQHSFADLMAQKNIQVSDNVKTQLEVMGDLLELRRNQIVPVTALFQDIYTLGKNFNVELDK
jgi:hypothetical protein